MLLLQRPNKMVPREHIFYEIIVRLIKVVKAPQCSLDFLKT